MGGLFTDITHKVLVLPSVYESIFLYANVSDLICNLGIRPKLNGNGAVKEFPIELYVQHKQSQYDLKYLY